MFIARINTFIKPLTRNFSKTIRFYKNDKNQFSEKIITKYGIVQKTTKGNKKPTYVTISDAASHKGTSIRFR